MNNGAEVYRIIEEFSTEFNPAVKEAAVILAAGHGKRIKSQTSKMLHKIWGIPTVERVYSACRRAIKNINIILVVGIKAGDVVNVIGKREATTFAYQEVQNGTGHAVQVALQKLDAKLQDGIIYILPGDMGLIDEETIIQLRKTYIESGSDMMVLTGLFEGNSLNNSYGRIVRVKPADRNGQSAGDDEGKVIEIIEFKDILSLPDDKPYVLKFKGREYCFTKRELLENNEFNSGVYAFNYKKLRNLIGSLNSNNVQNEIYITDMISLFNEKGYSVKAISPKEQYVVMGFNNKSVLKEMEAIARKQVYDKLKDIIEIKDPDDFFIDESVVADILELDKKNIPLDITVGQGVFIGKGVKLNYNLHLKKNAFVSGNVIFGQNVTVWENVHLSCFPSQTLTIGDNVEILWGDIIKGNIRIGRDARIESSVNITGSDDYPVSIGERVLIKGTSYIFGSVIEDELYIEHSVIIRKKIKQLKDKSGDSQPVRFYLPRPEGTDAVEDL